MQRRTDQAAAFEQFDQIRSVDAAEVMRGNEGDRKRRAVYVFSGVRVCSSDYDRSRKIRAMLFHASGGIRSPMFDMRKFGEQTQAGFAATRKARRLRAKLIAERATR